MEATAIEAAQALEDTADLLLIRGVCRDGTLGRAGGPRCVLGALSEMTRGHVTGAHMALMKHLDERGLSPYGSVVEWNDHRTTDDFEVIDTLRHVAKDLRNEATS